MKDEGVSNVVGAILVVGLLVVSMVTIRHNFVPRYEEDREAAHAEDIVQAMSFMVGDLEGQAASQTSSEQTHTVSLTRSAGSGLFRGNPTPSEASFGSRSAGASVEVLNLEMISQDGFPVQGNQWDSSAGFGTAQGVTAVEQARFRLGSGGGAATVDADGDVSMSLTRSGDEVVVTVMDQGTNIYSGIENCASGEACYINIFNEAYGFKGTLGSVSTPYSLTISGSGESDLSIAYRVAGSAGSVVAGGGRLIGDTTWELPSGQFGVLTRSQQFPQQRAIIEHGALLIAQPTGATIAVPPAFTISNTGISVGLSLSLPTLDGVPFSTTGKSISVATSGGDGGTRMVGLGSQAIFSLETEYPLVWREYFMQKLEFAGLSADDGDFSVVAGEKDITLTINGPIEAANSTELDVSLSLTFTPIALEVR